MLLKKVKVNELSENLKLLNKMAFDIKSNRKQVFSLILDVCLSMMLVCSFETNRR